MPANLLNSLFCILVEFGESFKAFFYSKITKATYRYYPLYIGFWGESIVRSIHLVLSGNCLANE
jgi:hypothetical protein